MANTTLNQATGQAIEAVSIMMTVYLTISLGISLFMNWYNKHSPGGALTMADNITVKAMPMQLMPPPRRSR